MNFIDPDGRAPEWIPDSNGNLIAEKGDNAASLAKYLNISPEEASNRINSQNLERENYVQSDAPVTEGQTLNIDNNMTKAIKQSSGLTTEENLNSIEKPLDPIDRYNCHQGSNAAVSGESIGPGQGSNISVGQRADYKRVSSDQAIFGKTLVNWNNKHTAVYYGTSKSGDIFVWSKNGPAVKPGVFNINYINSIKEYSTDINIFGNEVKIEPTFYNPID